ncbi:alanine-glyoxylate aminotransferase [Canna indica]|uniref:alanine--glyoxylate transaminase n=1 Tax=Canna indica TaxID=4628 RepID=A0AAQ3Q1Q7_9LILI|nr:alanine-glyoxylate aminotransferase [Canna indica]
MRTEEGRHPLLLSSETLVHFVFSFSENVPPAKFVAEGCPIRGTAWAAARSWPRLRVSILAAVRPSTAVVQGNAGRFGSLEAKEVSRAIVALLLPKACKLLSLALLNIMEGKMQYLYDEAGKRYLDVFAGIVTGVGRAVELAPGYLKLVYDIVRKADGVCIADEVQSGFGRTGSHYWGFETQGVIPDIVTMAKGIGNGLPLGAVVTTPEIASVMLQKIQLNTFGGNPVCSTGGLVVLNVLDMEKRQSHCADVGSHLIG